MKVSFVSFTLSFEAFIGQIEVVFFENNELEYGGLPRLIEVPLILAKGRSMSDEQKSYQLTSLREKIKHVDLNRA